MSNNTAKPPNNDTIITITQIFKAVMSLAAEAEVGGLYINCRKLPLPATPVNLWAIPTSNPNANRQHHRTWCCQQRRYEEIESNGHEIQLAPQERMLGAISTLLGPGQIEQRQLCDKASCHNSSPRNALNYPHKYLYLQALHQQLPGNLLEARLDIYCTIVWYNLHIYSKSHH